MSDANNSQVECYCDQLSDDSDDECIETKLKTKGVKRRKQVLDEDLYVEQIEKIIERDFFPDLIKLKQKSETQQTHSESNQKFCVERHPSESPSTFETPLRQSTANDDNIEDKDSDDKQSNVSLNLDQFLNKYTSEDNASFEQIQEQEEKKHRIKYKWFYKDCNKHNKEVKKLLELPSIEKQAICGSKDSDSKGTVAPITWTYTNKNTVMFNPSGVALTGDYKLANTKRQEVVHSNTRFERTPFNERVNQMTIGLAAQLYNRQKEGKIGIDGKELVSKETPQINGFKFVASTPTPAPEFYSESPLMTWGEIESTPMSLSGAETPLHPGLTPGSSHFKIPDLPEREKVGLSLAVRNAKQHRDRKKLAINTVKSSVLTPSSHTRKKTSLERLNSMSPAAQRLATSKLGLHRNVDRTLMASYSPARNSVSTPSLTPKLFSPLTPTPTLTPNIGSNDSKNMYKNKTNK